MKGIKSIITSAMALMLLLCAACGEKKSTKKGDARMVGVTIPPLAYFAEAIGGDSIEVVTLMPASANPETFEPGMSTLRQLSGATVLFSTGLLPFEKAQIGNLHANNPNMLIEPVDAGIQLIFGTHSHCDHSKGEHHNHSCDEPDPHIWSSVKNARIIAANMGATLQRLYPSLADYFASRLVSLDEKLDSLDLQLETSLKPGTAFAIWHPSLSYLARDYGLQQIAFNLENKETSSLRLATQIAEAQKADPCVFFVPVDIDQSKTEPIALELHAPLKTINPMTADWAAEIAATAQALASGQKQ